jgi:hypothetical protein
VNFLKGMALGFVGLLLFILLPSLGLAINFKSTLLNPQFIVNEAQDLDINSIVREYISKKLPPDDQRYLQAIDDTLVQLKPWIDEQVHDTVYAGYDYLLGKTHELNISISTDSIKPVLVDKMTQIYLQSPDPEYQQLSADQQKQYLMQYQQQFSNSIPGTIVINEDLVGAQGMQILLQAREGIRDFQTGYIISIFSVIALILLIVLILREIQAVFRSIGIIFLVDGILGTIFFFSLRQFLPAIIPSESIPTSIHMWLTQVIHDLFLPGGVFSLVLLFAGIVLVVCANFVGKKQSGEASVPLQNS